MSDIFRAFLVGTYWNFIGTTKREKYSTGDSTDMWDSMIDSYFNFGVIAGNLQGHPERMLKVNPFARA